MEGDGEGFNQVIDIGVHKCTENDYDDFYPATRASTTRIDQIHSQDAAWCFDKEDRSGNKYDLSVYGSSENEPFRKLDLSFRPCKPEVVGTPGVEHCLIPDDRPESYEAKVYEAKVALGNPSIQLIFNR